jgi:hypothetical protein
MLRELRKEERLRFYLKEQFQEEEVIKLPAMFLWQPAEPSYWATQYVVMEVFQYGRS